MITAKDFEKNSIIMSASFSHNMAPEIADQTIRNYLQNIHISNKNGNNLPKFNLKFAQTFIPNATNAHSDDIKKLDTALAYLQ